MAYDAEFVTGLYRIFFDREPDPQGFAHHVKSLQNGVPPHETVAAFLMSEEFANRRQRQAFESFAFELPNLRDLYPADFREEDGHILYIAAGDEHINRMESLITSHGYYDRFGVWSSTIDNDKKNMAQLVECFGPRTCLEIGCFNGPILSLLSDRGIQVAGVDPSHLAFVTALPNVRKNLIYGDLLSAKLDQQFDCIILLDVLEHVNPLKLGHHIQRLKELLAPGGVIIVNSPMFGTDPIFGSVFPQDIEEWRSAGDTRFFRSWPCDDHGWPVHGHMVFASPKWWERQFEMDHLLRLTAIEASIQETMGSWFTWAPARRSLFVLGHRGEKIDAGHVTSLIREKQWS
jgi:SAM-dependent methyltransferase